MIFMEIDENKEDKIKIFEVDNKTNVAYIINTILNIINRWDRIKIYIFNKSRTYKEEKKKWKK